MFGYPNMDNYFLNRCSLKFSCTKLIIKQQRNVRGKAEDIVDSIDDAVQEGLLIRVLFGGEIERNVT